MSAGVVLQARMGSRRLPGKVLASVGSASVLEFCIRRLATSGLPVIVATTERTEDDAVVVEARRVGAEVVRGSERDVLGRYAAAARTADLSTIVRATADNPFVDAESIGRLMAIANVVRADHLIEAGLPVGAAVEVITRDALERADTLAVDPYDREHVTSLIRRDPRFQALRIRAPRDVRRAELRLTVDTAHDLSRVQAIAAALGPRALTASLREVIAATSTEGPVFKPGRQGASATGTEGPVFKPGRQGAGATGTEGPVFRPGQQRRGA